MTRIILFTLGISLYFVGDTASATGTSTELVYDRSVIEKPACPRRHVPNMSFLSDVHVDKEGRWSAKFSKVDSYDDKYWIVSTKAQCREEEGHSCISNDFLTYNPSASVAISCKESWGLSASNRGVTYQAKDKEECEEYASELRKQGTTVDSDSCGTTMDLFIPNQNGR